MKKIIGALVCLMLVTSCSRSNKGLTKIDNRIAKKGDTVHVDYVGKLQDGTIFDSSIKEFAKKTKNYSETREYSPLSFVVGADQMIPGFDKGVEGMKIGEKKTLTIAPKDGYGEKTTKVTIDESKFAPTITEKAPMNVFQDYVEQEIPLTTLSGAIVEGKLKEGENVKLSIGLNAKIKKIDGEKVNLVIENKQNPFFGKKLKKGLTGNMGGANVKVVDINDKEKIVTVEYENKQNPFYGKKLTIGLETKDNAGKTIKIVDIKDKQVTLEVENSHELAGKTLIFDVELKDIKEATTQTGGVSK